MSTMRRYIMGKVQKYEVLTMEIPEELKELNPADQQLFLACGNLDVDKAAEAILNGANKCHNRRMRHFRYHSVAVYD